MHLRYIVLYTTVIKRTNCECFLGKMLFIPPVVKDLQTLHFTPYQEIILFFPLICCPSFDPSVYNSLKSRNSFLYAE